MQPFDLSADLKAAFWTKQEDALVKSGKARKPSSLKTAIDALAKAHEGCDLPCFDTAKVKPGDAEAMLATLRKQGAAAVKGLVAAAKDVSEAASKVQADTKKEAALKDVFATAQKIDQKTLALIAKAETRLREVDAALVALKEQAARDSKAPKSAADTDAANPDFKLVRSKAIAGLRGAKNAKKDTPPMQFLMAIGKLECLPYIAPAVGQSHRSKLLSLMEETSGVKWMVGTLLWEANAYTFVSDTPVSGVVRKLQTGLQRLTKAKLRVRVRSTEGAAEEAEGDAKDELPPDEPVADEPDPGPPMPKVGQGLAEPASVVEAAERVEALRADSETKRGRLKQAMEVVAAKTPVDLEMLRKLVAEEFARAKLLDDVMKKAKDAKLPIAPSPAKVGFDDNLSPGAAEWTPKVCAEAFRRYTWFEFKDLRKSGKPVDVPGLATQKTVTDDVMWKLYQYRRREVDKLIAGLQGMYKDSGLLFKSSGSEDIESDLDITVASTQPGDDVKAMRQFNAAIKAKFGRAPGRVFDTNLYARDYRAIEDNMTKNREGAAPKDRDIAEPQGELAKMSGIDQDVATLMKQRRFLDEETFTAMWHQLRDSVTDPVDKKRIQQRFEEAESAYLLTAAEKVEAIIDKVQKSMAKFTPEQRKAFDAQTAAFAKARSAGDLKATQKLLPQLLDLLEEEFPDEVMEATDDQYADRMTTLREEQAAVDRHERDLKEHKKQGADCDKVHPFKTHDEWAAETPGAVEALKANVKRAQFTNIVFANEAYMSEGAIAHVVAGMQASTPEKKAEVLAKIKPAELLQSTNEQLADFFKDMKHMEHAEKAAKTATEKRRATGEAFVHASKYLSRMLDAVAMLQEKYEKKPDLLKQLTTPQFDLCTRAGAASPRKLQEMVDAQLVRLRKSSTVPGDAKAELAVADVKKMFDVASVDALRKLITTFSIDFNKRVRQLEEFQEAQKVDDATFRQYFRPAQGGTAS